MNIKLTFSNLCARAAMLLLATVMSVSAWAQYGYDLSDKVTTIKCESGDFPKLLLKGTEDNYQVHYAVLWDGNKLEEGTAADAATGNFYAEITSTSKDAPTPVIDRGNHSLSINMNNYPLYKVASYVLTVTGIDPSYGSKSVYFSIMRVDRSITTGSTPFVINTKKKLESLRDAVNGGITFEGHFFRLDENLTFDNNDDIDPKDESETNYIPIGGYHYGDERNFCGQFDGGGHTIKGIRISYDYPSDVGLFGRLGNGAEVKNLTLDDAIIYGPEKTGGIVGTNSGGTITNCHVTSSVFIHPDNSTSTPSKNYHGGIVGRNGENGIIKYCTSSAKLTKNDKTCYYYGAITGYNVSNGTLSHNLVVGAIVPATTDNTYGAITGYNGTNNTIDHNYYTDCESIKGCAGKDINENSTYGAYPLATTPGVTTIILYDSGSKANENATTIGQNTGKHNVVLAGRTLYKDEKWNTLCLPFNLTISGSTLHGADARTLSTTDFDSTTGTLTLDFTPSPEEAGSVTSLTAGTPYIIKWSNGENLVNPVFTDVTIASFVQGTAADFLNSHAVKTNYAKFIGTYSPTGIYTSPAVNLYLGTNNTLYYPSAAKNINAFRAYFQLLNGLTAGDPESGLHVRAFSLNFDDDPTGIITTDYMDKDGAWYSLDGRKYSAKPTAKGLYINKGKKVVIK